MKPVDVARETLRRAVELHVLETEDVSAAGSLLQDPRELVDQLKADKVLGEKVEEALARLIHLRPSGVRFGGSATSKGRVIDLSGESGTLAGSREPDRLGDSKSGENEYAAARVALGDAGSSTLAPSRDESAPIPDTMTDGGNDPGGSTVAPLGDRPRVASSSAPVGGVQLGGEGSTMSPMRAGDDKPYKPDPGSETVAPLGERSKRAAAGQEIKLGGDGSTMAPMRGEKEPPPTGATLAGSAALDDAADSLVDLSVLEPQHRRAIEMASFCRIALRLQKVTRAQIAAAEKTGQSVEEQLLDSGAIDQAVAMEIFAIRANPRSACANCFGVLPPGHAPGSNCPVCGQMQTGITGSSSRLAMATMSDGGGGAQGIEGFPGQGGMFAGYELLDRIAEGGMGVVFKARQVRLNRIVALKVMRGGSLANKERRRRFRQEAESAAAIRHPCIVPVIETGEEKGYPFYTMEFVEGSTMERYVADKKLEREPKKICELVRGVAGAVQNFHQRGIIHRDLKPGNILVAEDNVPKIIDFGIAKKLVPDSDSSTIEGEILGTPYYMSPEQATGRVTEVDTRTDVYALGAILFELLTGAPPWKGLRQARLIAAIQEEDPESIRAKNPAVELDLESIVFKAMSKERERRYQSAADLATDLERYENNMTVTARPATFGYRLKKYVRRHLPYIGAAAIVFVGATSVVSAIVIQSAKTRALVAQLVTDGLDKTKTPAEREAALNRALGMDPGNQAARSGLTVLEQDRDQAAKLAAAKAEEEKKTEQMRREKERLENEQKLANAQKDADAKAAQAVKQDAERRALALLDQAAAKKDALDAIPDLSEALIVLPKDSAAARTKIENKKIDLELGLAREQVVKNQSGLARFWLGDARRLETAKARDAEFARVEEDLRRLESGEKELEKLHDLVAKSDWLHARPLLEQLKKLGIDPGRIAADQDSVEKACAQRAAQLVADGRTLLAQGDPANGMAKALEAQQFETSEAVKALVGDCEREDTLAARRRAAEDWKRPETQKSALVALAQTAERVQTPALKALLEGERAARARLLDDRSLAGLCFVPAVPDLGVAAVFVQQTEVTNADWKQFVDAGGYGMADLWVGVSAEVQATFRDGCAGGTCTHKGPRTWTNGGFGDPANAERPVRGVTVHEARAYARWKSRQAGGTWRLPSDREWEIAAGFEPRTQRLTLYPWGDAWRPSSVALASDLPRPVSGSPADVSALGVSDMGGNVMEWVEQKDGQAATKGVSFAASEAVAKRFALVRSTGTPGSSPPPELLQWIGFRLVRAIEEK